MRAPFSVAGQVVAITGGARGIGAAIARDLAGRGARVALGDLAEQPAAELAAHLGAGAIGLPLDVTSTDSYRTFLRRVEAELGPIDVLIGNAGVMWVGPFEEEPEAVALRQFEVNVHGVLRGIKLVAPVMRARRRGHIVTIASVAGKVAPRGEATYAATKHAVYGYCCAVQAELHRSGVALSIVMPTVVETELAAGTSPGMIRRLTPEDVAAGVWTALCTRRRDVYVPRAIGLFTRTAGVLPGRLGVAFARWTVPNQLRKTDRARRRGYDPF